MRYLTVLLALVLSACVSPQYSHVSKEGCGTIARNLEIVAMARDQGVPIDKIIEANKIGIRGCWVNRGAAGCAIQDEVGLAWVVEQIHKIYSVNEDPDVTGTAIYKTCLKEKGITMENTQGPNS